MLLGIDLGTSALKMVLFDPHRGRVTHTVREPITVYTPHPGWAEMDPRELWALFPVLLRRLERESGVDLAIVQAVGLSTVFPALLPLDRTGEPLAAALLYCDLRSVEQVEGIRQSLGRERFEGLTGNRLTPGTSTLPGILWLRDRSPRVYAQTHVFGQISTFLVRRLTGEFTVDTSHTSLSAMVASGAEDRWCQEILDAVGLDADRLPRIQAPTTVVGTVTAAAAAFCGLRRGTPVVTGCGDTPLAALGAGVVRAGQLFCSAGTTDCLCISAERPSGNPVFCNVRHAVDGLWLAIGTMSTAGGAVKWFCEQFARCTPEAMMRDAESAPVGSAGLLFLPYLQGERTPWWDPHARGVFFGLSLATGHAEACRAVFEGIACGWRQIISLLESEYGLRAPELLCVGGGSGNVLLNRLKATLLDRPVHALHVTEITGLGAALIAGVGVGIFPDAMAACAASAALRTGEWVDPVPEWADACASLYARYERLYPAVKPLFAG